MGVVLSGTLDDGTAGLLAIKQRGGVAVVQDPDEALYAGMPRSAIENVDVDYILRMSDISSRLTELAYRSVEMEEASVSSEIEMEADIAEFELEAMQDFDRPGKPSGFGCPECGGSLWELQEGSLIRFRCRTGHAYSTGSLLAEQSEALETALWTALRALEEKAALVCRLADRARDRHQPLSAKRFAEQAQVAQQRAALMRRLLLKEDDSMATDVLIDVPAAGNGQVLKADSSVAVQGDDSNLPVQPATAKTINFKVVALCASAGGLKALSQILSALPADFPCAITVVQHLSPQHSSQLADILSRRTALAVKQAETGDVLYPGKVYIAPPDHHLLVNSDGTLSLSHTELVHFVRPSADLLLESMAASLKQQAIAVVLTGSGVDGAMGVRAIKQMGGSVVVQNQETSEVFGMPGAAIATGSADLIVSLEEIATTLVGTRGDWRWSKLGFMSNLELDPEFEALLDHVKRDRGFDFTGYKRSTLMRRVQKCMQAVGIESYSDYLNYLEVHPEEFAHLFNTIFINVTSFFRDYSAWEYISREIVPRIVARKEPNEPIRVWSAGCASGQEAYTLAIILAEALGSRQVSLLGQNLRYGCGRRGSRPGSPCRL